MTKTCPSNCSLCCSEGVIRVQDNIYARIGKTLFCKDCEAYRPFADWLSEGPCHRHPPQRDSGSHPPVYQAVRVRDFDFCFDLIPKEEK